MSDSAYLVLMLDGPMQSWGFASRFQRRTTGMHPTKSGVIGMICAAMGLAKGSAAEQEILPKLASLWMMTIAIPRIDKQFSRSLPVLRLVDYHTVLDTRRASGKMNQDAVITHRQYLLDSRFGVILFGEGILLANAAEALKNPQWGVWLGRKSCIPAEPIYRGIFQTQDEAQRELIDSAVIDRFTRISEVGKFAEGNDSICDQPINFGDGTSSGPDKRQFAHRRIYVQPASQVS
jgi:CRISPR system Cascade subunit CasD